VVQIIFIREKIFVLLGILLKVGITLNFLSEHDLLCESREK
jgi:hypothetical protein